MKSRAMNSKSTTQKRKYRLVNRILAAILPRYGKRAIFLTTLFVHIAKLSLAHRKLLEEFNQKFRVVKGDSALGFPTAFCNAVWRGRELDISNDSRTLKDLTAEDLDLIAERAIHSLPEWSRYGEQSTVRAEAREVLRQGLDVDQDLRAT